MTSPLPPSPVSCADVAAALAAYRDGTLAGDRAWQLEGHAAHCAACATLLDTPVSLPGALPAPDAITQAAMRRDVLARVRATPRASARWRRLAPWAVLAAAAALALMLVPERPPMITTPTDRTLALDSATSAPMRRALELAEAQAATEFAALDAAEAELKASLASAPDDADLQRFHDALESRRRELTQRVVSVTE